MGECEQRGLGVVGQISALALLGAVASAKVGIRGELDCRRTEDWMGAKRREIKQVMARQTAAAAVRTTRRC